MHLQVGTKELLELIFSLQPYTHAPPDGAVSMSLGKLTGGDLESGQKWVHAWSLDALRWVLLS